MKTACETGPALAASTYQVDLSALLATCESNFWRLKKLLPMIDEQDESRICLPHPVNQPHGIFLLFRVVERCPYTTTLSVTLCKDGEGACEGDPWGMQVNMTVRIYDDVQSAEVIAFQKRRHFKGRYDYPNQLMHQPDEKMQLNLLLAEWLSHCLSHGHVESCDVMMLVSSIQG